MSTGRTARRRSGLIALANAREPRDLNQTGWLVVLATYMGALIAFGALHWARGSSVEGLLRILVHPGLLLSDYIDIGGIGPAFVNAGLVGLSGLMLVLASGVLLSGPTIAAVFTMAGFGLFGKNVWSIWPIIAGVYVFARATGRPFKSYLLVALFGTALAPLVTQIAFGYGYGIVAGTLVGMLAGFALSPLAVYMLRLHQGYNIYNVGLTCGFLGVFISSLMSGGGLDATLPFHWSHAHSKELGLFLVLYSGSLLAFGLWLGTGFERFRELVREHGVLPTDFVELYGPGTTLVNMGLVGLIGWAYIAMVGGDYNGPTLGGVLTMVGFASFGKHVLNIVPVMLGVYLGSRALVWEPNAAGPLLAALFATTLAPLSVRFGPFVGLLAGIVHLSLVMRTASWHGGLNLYNNGFAGGLTATLFVGFLGWWSTWRSERAGKE